MITAGPIVSGRPSRAAGTAGAAVSMSAGPSLGLSHFLKEPEGRNLPTDRTLWLAQGCQEGQGLGWIG